jgi:GNAT superfamily N-acetyltransferase
MEISTAGNADAAAIAALRNAVAAQLTAAHGNGHWSSCVSRAAVLRQLRQSHVLILREAAAIVATLRLTTREPWAIDTSRFETVARPVYLHGLAVAPDFQRRGIGRQLVAHAKTVAGNLPGDAIRLDAYDSPAGAGPFYLSCGFREVGRVVYRRVPLIYFELLL